jgi:hypothetical protein
MPPLEVQATVESILHEIAVMRELITSMNAWLRTKILYFIHGLLQGLMSRQNLSNHGIWYAHF